MRTRQTIETTEFYDVIETDEDGFLAKETFLFKNHNKAAHGTGFETDDFSVTREVNDAGFLVKETFTFKKHDIEKVSNPAFEAKVKRDANGHFASQASGGSTSPKATNSTSSNNTTTQVSPTIKPSPITITPDSLEAATKQIGDTILDNKESPPDKYASAVAFREQVAGIADSLNEKAATLLEQRKFSETRAAIEEASPYYSNLDKLTTAVTNSPNYQTLANKTLTEPSEAVNESDVRLAEMSAQAEADAKAAADAQATEDAKTEAKNQADEAIFNSPEKVAERAAAHKAIQEQKRREEAAQKAEDARLNEARDAFLRSPGHLLALTEMAVLESTGDDAGVTRLKVGELFAQIKYMQSYKQ